MRPQYIHDAASSFVLWLQNRLQGTGQGYVNVTGSLYLQADSSVNGYEYASPYRQWVYDSSVAGADIPSGFYTSSGQYLTRASGVVLNFVNGRVVSAANWGPSISGSYSRSEVNVYLSSTEEVDFVLEQAYGTNPNVSYALTGLQGRVLAAPLVMVTPSRGNNIPWALGGTKASENALSCFILTPNAYLQDAVVSLCQDAYSTYIPLATYADVPITASGDLKTVPWSYCTGIKDRYGCAAGMYVQNAYTRKISEKTNRNQSFLLAVADLDVIKVRTDI